MRILFILFFVTIVFACETSTVPMTLEESNNEKQTTDTTSIPTIPAPQLHLKEANRLVRLPLECMDTEYPNKLNQVLNERKDLLTPKQLHPAFYGCFDWHSAVHGHWSLVRLLKTFPNLENAATIRKKIDAHLTAKNIQQELAYFERRHNKEFERTYGWAWLLKLAEELHDWEDPQGQQWKANLQPLTDFIIQKYITFLPKLSYPVREGTHKNTAFGLAFAYDYAQTTENQALKTAIESRAKAFFSQDTQCRLSWEPSGYDFLSPCLEEANIMRRILPPNEFKQWIKEFLPELLDKNFTLEPAIVSNREDKYLIHLDGVNFSRAWCLYGLTQTLDDCDHLLHIAHQHIHHSLPVITDNNYGGEHWLASFALYALAEVRQ
jgi:hypothetical protein